MTIYNEDYPNDLSSADGLKDDILYFEWLYNQLENSKTKLWILGLSPYESKWNNFIVEKYNRLAIKPDKILLNSLPENYTAESWNNVIDRLLEFGHSTSQIMAIYGNFISPISRIPHLPDYRFLNRYQFYKNINYTDIFNRKHKFVSLAGMPRPNRIVFTKELLIRNLQQHGIITCGSLKDHRDKAGILYDYFDLGEYRSKFPVIYDTEYPGHTADDIHPPFLDAIYNVVVESAFEDYLNLKKHPELSFFILIGTDPIMSEKTTKAFGSYQIPVFVASKGYVAEIRKLGFDVFDDVVDHSYDSIDDPHQRMIVIANEVERLVNTNLPNNNLKNRLIRNHDIMEELYFKQKQRISLEILKWFNQ